jgi:hypothetical protein
MAKVIVFSAARPSAVENLQRTVVEGVNVDLLRESRMIAELQRRADDGKVRVWGIQPGARDYKLTSWARLDSPVVAFFYTDGGVRYVATMWAKEPPDADGSQGNPALSQAIWDDPEFELIGYVEDFTPVDVAAEDLAVALGYEPAYRFRESVVPNESIQDAIIAEFGTAVAFRDAVIGHVGTPPLDEVPTGALPADSMGAEYRPEDENAASERSDVFRVDPDKIDRGTRAHRRTQELLADHLRSEGLTPRSWTRGEPLYDVAWEDGDSFFVAEIKSLTPLNEERQLRLALGQILRYAHQLRYKSKPVQKVIAVERAPTKPEWSELCASLDVKLVWPDSFGELASPSSAGLDT